MLIQIILSFFLLFALTRVILQLRSSKLTLSAFFFWSSVFIIALLGVIEPGLTTYVAQMLGIGRGADVVLYISIALLFYMVFRLSIALEDVRREISQLVRHIALNETQHKKKTVKRGKGR